MFKAQQQGPKHLNAWCHGKVLKRRYWTWPRIGHLDISSPSYGQKKGWESNLKVGNRPLPDIRFECATWHWKDLDEGYNFGSDLVMIRLCSRELWAPKVSGVRPRQFRDSISRVPRICAIWMYPPLRAAENTLWGKVVASPESRPWWVLCVKVPVACPNTQGCFQMLTNLFWLVFGCRFTQHKLVPLPSLIPGLPTRPSTPF
jgi:hypothetical protein